MEEMLDAKGCPDEQRVSLASLMLKGEAELWWWGIQGRVAAIDTPITWEIFRTLLLKRYSPALLKRKRDKLPLEGNSGGSVMDEKVAPRSECRSLTCVTCGKSHKGICLWGQEKCFYCFQKGHLVKDCPRKKKVKILATNSQGDRCS
ncbi:Zinc finger, CCHC-type [Sesbania bispinosa]|nr:Zinc finger, CCHC-type [Sesbania bispinosa]